MSNFDDFSDDIGLGQEDASRVRSNQVDWYLNKTAVKGQTDRISLVYFHPLEVSALRKAKQAKPDMTDADKKNLLVEVRKARAEELKKPVDQLDEVDMLDTSESRFKAVDASFQDGLGYVQWPKTLADGDKAVWSKLPEKRTYVLTVVLIYPTDRDGEIERDRLATRWEVKPWRFSPEKYDRLRKINRGQQDSGGITAHDLLVTCKEPKFQNIDMISAGPAIWRQSAPFRRKVLERALPLYAHLGRAFRSLTTDELREKLGMAPSSSGGSSGVGDDFESILGSV